MIKPDNTYKVTSGHGEFRLLVTKTDSETVTGKHSGNLALFDLFPSGTITVRRCNASFK